MTTSLARQLMRLRVQQKDEPQLPKKAAPSFLFDIQDAARIDVTSIYPLALTGLDYLATVDPSFSEFTEVLFPPASKTFNRFTRTVDELQKVDSALAELIKKLCPQFLLPACHKVLEYLIRVYDVHVYHREMLIDGLMPYIDSPLFVRLLQLLNLRTHPTYSFLDARVQRGNLLNKQVLVAEIAKNPKVLERLCAFSLSQPASIYYTTFVSMLAVQLLSTREAAEKLSADHVRILLKYVSEVMARGKDAGIGEETLEAVLAIALRVSSVPKISQEYVHAVFADLVQGVKSDQVQSLVWKGVVTAVQNNENVTFLPEEVMTKLYARNPSLMAKDHDQFITEYDLRRYATCLGTTLAENPQSPKTTEFLSKMCWSEQHFQFLTGVISAILAKACNKSNLKAETARTTFSVLAKSLEAKDTYVFCKWMNVFFEAPEHRAAEVCALFGTLRSFRAQYISGDSKTPLFPIANIAAERTHDWFDTVVSHLAGVGANEQLSEEDKRLYSSVVRVVAEEKTADTDTLYQTMKLPILSRVFEAAELLDLHMDFCERFAGEETEKFKEAFGALAATLSAVKSSMVQPTETQTSKFIMLLVSAILDESMAASVDIALANLPASELLQKLFAGVAGAKDRKAQLVANISAQQNWLNVLTQLRICWENTWRMRSVNSGKIAELLLAVFPGLKQYYEFFLNDIIVLFHDYTTLLLSMSAEVTQPWVGTLVSEIIKMFPSLEDPRLSLVQQRKLFVILENAYLFLISHKQFHTSLPVVLNKHFRTQAVQFHIYLLLKHPEASVPLIRVVCIMLKQQEKAEVQAKLPLLFAVVFTLRSALPSVRRAGLELAQTLQLVKAKCDSPLKATREFFARLRGWTELSPAGESEWEAKDLTDEKINMVLAKIVGFSEELALDKDQVLNLMPEVIQQDGLAGYFILGALALPLPAKINEFYLTLIRAKNSADLFPHFVRALSALDSLDNSHFAPLLKILLLHISPRLTSAHLPILRSLADRILKLEHLAQEQLDALLTLFRTMAGVTLPHPNPDEAVLVDMLLRAMRNKAIMSIKTALQQILGERSGDSLAQFIAKNALGKLDKYASDLYTIYESVLTGQKGAATEEMMKVSLELLGECKEKLGQTANPREYMLELLFSFIGRHIAAQSKFLVQYKKTLLECFRSHFEGYIESAAAMSGPSEHALRAVKTELYAAVGLADSADLYTDLMHIFEEKIKPGEGQEQLVETAVKLEGELLTGVIASMRANVQLSYALLRTFVSHICGSGASADAQAELMQRWIPTQEGPETKAKLVSVVCIGVCECVAAGAETAMATLKLLIGRIEPQCAIETFVSVLAFAYQLSQSGVDAATAAKGKEKAKDTVEALAQNIDELRDLVPIAKLETRVVSSKPTELIKYLNVVMSLIIACLEERKIVGRCATDLPLETSMGTFGPGYVLLVLFYYQVCKTYKASGSSGSSALAKLYRALIRSVQNTMESLETMLSKGCACELARNLLRWRRADTMKATMRILKMLVERSSAANGDVRAWQDPRVQYQFKRVLEDVVEGIAALNGNDGKSAKDIQCLQLLVALATNAVSMHMPECEDVCIKLVPKSMEGLLEKETTIKFPMLFTAVYLCYAALFKSYSTQMVLHAETLINHIHKSLATATGKLPRDLSNDSEQFRTNSAIVTACLKTLNTLTQTVPQFIDTYVSTVVGTLMKLPDLEREEQTALCKSIGKNVPSKSVIFALAENYDAYQRLEGLGQIKNYLTVLEECCANFTSAYISANYGSVFDLLLILMPYSQFYFDLHKTEHPEIGQIESSILSALSAFVVKLNGHQFKEAFLKLAKWAQKKESSSESAFGYSLRRCTMFLKAGTKLAEETLHNLYLPYLVHYQQFLAEIVSGANACLKSAGAAPDFVKPGYGMLIKYFHPCELNRLAAEHVKVLFDKDTDQSIENEVFQALSLPIIDQIDVPALGQEYIKATLAPCLISMIERINSEDAWKYAINLILMKTRGDETAARLGATTVMERIVDRMQDKLLGMLGDIAPFAAECLEDENEEVVENAKKILHTFELITGESIDKFLR